MRTVLAKDIVHGNINLVASFTQSLNLMEALAVTGTTTVRGLELALNEQIVALARQTFAHLLGVACRDLMLRDLQDRGLTQQDVRLRTDERGYATMETTFGSVRFPIFSYWDKRGILPVYHSPARDNLLAFQRNCRSSPLCLEWEATLGAQHPFRSAEQALKFFTRGATTLADNTIEEHVVTVGELIEREWLYQKPQDIQVILQSRATRDRKTNQPILYCSTDAHALRRYTDETWRWDWKMVNGIRIWCEDAKTGKLIHLGGEYLWGKIEATADAVRGLISAGILPNDTPEWKAINARLVFVSDASQAIVDHILPLLPEATVILDPYHVLGWFAELGTEVFRGKGRARKARELYQQAWRIVLCDGRPIKGSKPLTPRLGHQKIRASRKHAYDRTATALENVKHLNSESISQQLLALLATLKLRSESARDTHRILVNRLTKNALRMDYAQYLSSGFQIGSGAMESFHTTGSQKRLKVPGARWLEATSQAILCLRMLQLSGRWDEFWSQPELDAKLALAFMERTTQRRREREARDARCADREAA